MAYGRATTDAGTCFGGGVDFVGWLILHRIELCRAWPHSVIMSVSLIVGILSD